MTKFQDKFFLENEIRDFFQLIGFSFQENIIQIHYNKGEESQPDFGRIGYTLFTISRLSKFSIVDFSKEKLQVFLTKILNKINLHQEAIFCLYLLLICKNLNQDYLKYLQILKEKADWNFIFQSPVTMYIFMRVRNEIKEVEEDDFLESIYNACLKNFDHLLLSGVENMPPFYFADFIYYEGKLPKYFSILSQKYLQNNFEKYLSSPKTASSGVGKALEFFAAKKDFINLQKGLNFLETRKYKKLGQFRNFYLDKYESCYSEYANDMYVCLDANTHLINAYLNLYEKLE
jgi:hypothetical protein